MNSDRACYVGIDVAKAKLDIAVRATNGDDGAKRTYEHYSISNDDAGIIQATSRLQQLQPALIVLEATGGLELPVVTALVAAGILAVAVVNPRQVRDFA